MGKIDGEEVVPAARSGVVEEERPRQVEVVSEREKAEEKPRASEEIVIEEISIDGMCGVY